MDAALQLPAAYGLNGRVVTMDAGERVVERATVYVEGATIGAIVAPGDAVPERFAGAPVIGSGGTIYPGLIELHNHLAYNALPLWQVPRQFANRDGWQDGANRLIYRKLISGPMGILGRTPGLVEAIVRYTEAKCLLGGTTTSQGIALYSNQGTQKLYEGTVRNVERPGSLYMHSSEANLLESVAAWGEPQPRC